MAKKLALGPGDWAKVYGEDFDVETTTDNFSYGHLDFRKESDSNVFVPKYLTGSDYSGSLVERSNYEVFMEMFGEVPGVHAVYGVHGTYGIAIAKKTLEENEEIQEQLDRLSDYPILDEDHHSKLEMEAQDKAWDVWGEYEFKQELVKVITPYVQEILDETKNEADAKEITDRYVDDQSDSKIYEVFHNAMEESNTNWENEQGPSMHVDLKRVVDKGISDEQLEKAAQKAVKSS